ncbi:MAG TPA: chemotaxis protein CheB [Gemmatimonadaceae bacterium]|nr:chemotaxis protein CheB [Gemmatimonadaceae bacterium]
MIAHDIVVVGGSAGGVEALLEVARGLPAALAANVLVTVHLAASSPSLLPALVARVGSLPASHPADRTPLIHGQIFVAPPDYHLLCTPDGVRLGVGPRENGYRPSIDVLFRTAARHFGPRVLGVILSGNLDDGTAGALEIRRCGGSVIAQDPDDTLHPSMPQSAIRAGAVDHVLPLAALAGDIDRMSRAGRQPTRVMIPSDDTLRAGRPRPGVDPQESGEPPGSAALSADASVNEASGFTCPECHGALWEVRDGRLLRYRCRVGHAFSTEALIHEQAQSVEAALWTALTALEEHAAFNRRMVARLERDHNNSGTTRFLDRARDLETRAETIRGVLARGPFGDPDAMSPPPAGLTPRRVGVHDSGDVA